MYRILFLTTAALLGAGAQAAEFDAVAPVRTAIVYQQGAQITRGVTLDLPAGDHLIRLPALAQGRGLPDVGLTGGTLASVTRSDGGAVDGTAFFTDEQAQTYADVLAAEDSLGTARDTRLRRAAAVTAAADRLAYLRTITGAALTSLDPDAVVATGDRLAEEISAAETERANGSADLRAADRDVREAETVLAQVTRDFSATGARLGPIPLLEVAVTIDAPGDVRIDLTEFAQQAGWAPIYEATLNETEDQVTLDRKLRVFAAVGMPLRDVTLRLSTADPFAATAPQPVTPSLVAPRVVRSRQDGREATVTLDRVAPAPVAEPLVRSVADTSGPVVAYDYQVPVDLAVDGSPVVLSLDTLTFDARVFNAAAPRRDKTAFRVAEVVNTSQEPLLAGDLTVFREAARIGETRLPLVPAGDRTDIAFGPQQHLQLAFVLQQNATGDRGVFRTSGTRRQGMSFRVTNLSDTPETVEALFALPFAEDEAIEVEVATNPDPDARDVEDKRGVGLWSLNVDAGETVEVDISVDLEWPEGQVLDYRP